MRFLLIVTLIIRFNIAKTQVKLIFIIIIIVITIVIKCFISSLCFYPYNLYCLRFKVILIVCDILRSFCFFLPSVNCLFIHFNQCFDRKKKVINKYFQPSFICYIITPHCRVNQNDTKMNSTRWYNIKKIVYKNVKLNM